MMSRVYQEFERQMKERHLQRAGRPEREMIDLFLLALEREEIVSIAYRESLMTRRLNSLPVSEDIRELMLCALVWIWRDEEMHAIYIRGATLKLRNRALRLRVFVHQLTGVVGGWSSSLQQHKRWTEAPFSHSLASLISWAGALLNKVPREVRRNLRYGPIRDFCLFNIEAEKTALLCWERLVELAGAQGSPTLAEDFARVRDDEDRHRRIFEILASAFDSEDRVIEGETADTLSEKIGRVGEFFLPRARRKPGGAAHPIGKGGRVWIAQGQTAGEKLPVFYQILNHSGLEEQLQERAKASGKAAGDLGILVKPAFMLGYHRKDLSPITDPSLIKALARWLHERGCRNVAVAEARNLYDCFYRNRTVRDVAHYFGLLEDDGYEIVDLSEDQVPQVYFRGMGQYTVARRWRDADFRISFGKMRSHPTDLVFLTVANCESIGTRCEEFLFVERQAQRNTATMMLLDAFPPHFSILDAYDLAPDGVVGVMGCPRPKNPRRFYAGADALSVDIVAGRHIGLDSPFESDLLRMACHWFGDPSGRIDVVSPDTPLSEWRDPHCNEWSALLSLLAYPVYEFASHRGALFVPEMDEEAFPPVKRTGAALKMIRGIFQGLIGLRHSR